MILVEACVTSVDEAHRAHEHGADRLELCKNLAVGGLTPDRDVVYDVLDSVPIPTAVMVRRQARDFRASTAGLAHMVAEVEELVNLGADGIVVGVLDPWSRIDKGALRELVNAAAGCPVTFHKAFDQTPDLDTAFGVLALSGVARVLTSGGRETAWAGRDVLRGFVNEGGRPRVLAGGGVRGDHVVGLVSETGVQEVHARASAIAAVVDALAAAGLHERPRLEVSGQ